MKKGTKMTAEQRGKLSISHLGKTTWNKSKYVGGILA